MSACSSKDKGLGQSKDMQGNELDRDGFQVNCPSRLRVVFPLRGLGKPLGWKSPKDGERFQIPPFRSDLRNRGKSPKTHKKCIFGVFFPFWEQLGGTFPILGAQAGDGNLVVFSPGFGLLRAKG